MPGISGVDTRCLTSMLRNGGSMKAALSTVDHEMEDTTIYQVVVNHEEQYSIWPADCEIPLGWTDAGRRGTKTECLSYIEEVWTDMRPLSLRKKMAEMERGAA